MKLDPVKTVGTMTVYRRSLKSRSVKPFVVYSASNLELAEFSHRKTAVKWAAEKQLCL